HLIHGLAELVVVFPGTNENEVFNLVVGKFAFAKNGVEEFCGAADRDLEADCGLHAGARRPAVAARAASHTTNLLTFGAFFDMISADILFRRTVAKKCATVRQQFPGGFLVQGGASGLVERALVPIDAKPGEAVENAVDEFGLVALGVGILDAEDHGAPLAAGEKPVKQGRARAPYMEIAGGGRGETYAKPGLRTMNNIGHERCVDLLQWFNRTV